MMLTDAPQSEKQPCAGEQPVDGVPKRQEMPTPSLAWLRVVLIVALAMGCFFRFAYLDRKVYWSDEVITSLWFSGYSVAEVREGLGEREIGVEEVLKYQQANPERGMGHFLAALALDDAHHPPGYYGLVWLWAAWVGDSVATVRGLSAFLSLLAFPCLFWLCRELFRDPLTPWVALALLAVSPFHVLYAQEAREYSLLTVITLLSSASLLRALRLGTMPCWASYTVTVVLGLYSSLLFGVVVVAHGIYVAGASPRTTMWKGVLWPEGLKGYLVVTLVGLGAFTPWVVVLLINMTRSRDSLAWMTEDKTLFGLLDGWCFGIHSVFLDLVLDRDSVLALTLRLPIVLLAAGSLVFLYRHTRPRIWLLVFSLVGSTLLTTVVPDLLLGGRRSCVPRYALAGYLAALLATAYLLATQIASPNRWQRKAWQAVLVALVGGGLASNALSSQAVRWWNKGQHNNTPLAANVINQSGRPLVVSDFGYEHFGNVISLGHRLEPRVRLWLMLGSDVPPIPDGFSDVFLFKPSARLCRQFEASGYQVEGTSAPGLCRIQRRGAG
jgi:uncharacterized membrane protein